MDNEKDEDDLYSITSNSEYSEAEAEAEDDSPIKNGRDIESPLHKLKNSKKSSKANLGSTMVTNNMDSKLKSSDDQIQDFKSSEIFPEKITDKFDKMPQVSTLSKSKKSSKSLNQFSCEPILEESAEIKSKPMPLNKSVASMKSNNDNIGE